MRAGLTLAALPYLLLLTPVTHAASLPCAKAVRPVEKSICSDPKLSATDAALANAYRAALSRVSPAAVGKMRVDQIQWLVFSAEICRANEPGTPRKNLAECLKPLYRERLQTLRAAVAIRDGVTFFTRTEHLAAPDRDNLGRPDYPGFGTLKASWPEADSADAEWVAWNAALEARVLRLAAAPNADEQPKQPTGWSTSMAASLDSEVTAHIRSLEHGRVSASLNQETMEHGGAHPYEDYGTLTWVLAAQRPLQVADVFAEGSPWRQIVGQACYKSLQADKDKKAYLFKEVNGPNAKGIQDVIADTNNWTLEHDGLHISYPEYKVAPRVAQPDDTVVPWTALKPALAVGFVAP